MSETESELDPTSEDLLTKLSRQFGMAPAWVASLGLHVIVLMILSTIVYYPPQNLFNNAISTEMLDLDEQPVVVDASQVDTIGSNSDQNLTSLSSSSATLKGDNPQTEVEKKLEEQINPEPVVALTDVIETPAEDDLVAKVDKTGAAATETTGGTEGAIDRITYELLTSLRERKTLVVWLFDASLSLKERRDLIADRFENVYKQLAALDSGASKHLKTAIVTFGEKTNILTPEPIDNVDEVARLVRGIKNDASGKENTFETIVRAHKKFISYAKNTSRKMIFIVVTDERGDDAGPYLEDAITQLRSPGTKCFVVGNSSPFGREKGYVTWTYPPPDGGTEDIEVDLGPETYYPEILRLPFWGSRGVELERLTSGYGPYGLTRLCSETGGVYLIAEEGQGPKFDPYVMRNYSPDYRPIRKLEQDLAKNTTKRVLVEAAKRTFIDNISVPQTYFRANNDNELRGELTEAQKPAAVLDQKLAEMETILAMGEKDRDKVTEPRWRAAYDLAYGRVLAMRARTFGYNNMLAEMKVNPRSFTKKGSNQWQLIPAKEINTIPEVKKKAAKAAQLLKRVIDDHPDTPWALLAETELAVPMGWDWKEGMDEEARLMNATPEEKKARLLLADEEKKKREKRMQMEAGRQKPKL